MQFEEIKVEVVNEPKNQDMSDAACNDCGCETGWNTCFVGD